MPEKKHRCCTAVSCAFRGIVVDVVQTHCIGCGDELYVVSILDLLGKGFDPFGRSTS